MKHPVDPPLLDHPLKNISKSFFHIHLSKECTLPQLQTHLCNIVNGDISEGRELFLNEVINTVPVRGQEVDN